MSAHKASPCALCYVSQAIRIRDTEFKSTSADQSASEWLDRTATMKLARRKVRTRSQRAVCTIRPQEPADEQLLSNQYIYDNEVGG